MIPITITCHTYTHTHTSHSLTDSGEYSTVGEANSLLGKPIHPKEVILEDKIGEGQFGDVHKGVLYPNVSSVCLQSSRLTISWITSELASIIWAVWSRLHSGL